MPAIASQSINDGQAAPVAHTFAPVSTTGKLAKWADRSPSIPAGFRTLSFEYNEPSGNRSAHKLSWGFYLPVVATVNGVDTVVRYNSGIITMNLAPDGTLQERKDTRAYMANSLDLAFFVTAIENLEPAY